MELHLIFGNTIPIPEKFPHLVYSVINQPLIDSLSNTIPISSFETEFCFSLINITMTSERNKLITLRCVILKVTQLLTAVAPIAM